MAETEELLHILIQLNARNAFPEDVLRPIVGASERQIEAYNLCDGTRTQAEVVKASKLDQGQLSRTTARWIQEGVLFKLGTGRDVQLLHLYPLLAAQPAAPKAKGKRTASKAASTASAD